VYVDVSGSITGELKAALYGTVLGCREFVFPRVHLFSTQVADVTVAQLRTGECRSTGGTDIACVADHMRRNKVRRAVILTDGYVGSPTGADGTTLLQAVLGVALTPGTSTRGDLQEVASHWAELN
jgi:predicted metal-dependent peptidase